MNGRLDSSKRAHVLWALCSLVVAVVFGLLWHTQAAKAISLRFFKPRPFYVAVCELAKQNYELTGFPSVLRIDEAANTCKGELGLIFARSITNSRPSFSRFVLSEKSQIVHVYLNTESVEGLDFKREDYTEVFGNVPKKAKVRPLLSACYNLGKVDVAFVIKNRSNPGLMNFYLDAPKLFPDDVERKKFSNAQEIHYQDYLSNVRASLYFWNDLFASVIQGTVLFASLNLIACFFATLRLYGEYRERMHEEGKPIAHFTRFVMAYDIKSLMRRELDRQFMYLEEQNKERTKRRRDKWLEEKQKSLCIPIQDTSNQVQQRRLDRLQGMCTLLREITPPECMERTELTCLEAMQIVDFKEARDMLSKAYERRKMQNDTRRIVPQV